jgi:hypothetical protein
MRDLQCKATRYAGLVLFTGVLLTGCGKDNGPTLTELTDAQAAQVGAAIASQVELMANSFTVSDLSNPTFFAPGSPVMAAAPMRSAGPCPGVSDLTDTDGDGVPDDVTFTYSLPDCSFTDSSGVGTEVTGTIRIVDPSTTGIAYNGTFTSFAIKFIGQNQDFFTTTLSGTRGLTATTASASLNENLTLDLLAHSGNQNVSGRLTNSWSANFNVTSGQLAADQDLPDGTLTIDGNTGWKINGESFAFTVNTSSPLIYSASCLSDQRFTGGQLRALIEGNDQGAFVQITFNGCGVEPTVVLVSGPTA